MIEVNSVLFMGLWELVLLLLAVDVVIVVRFVIRRRREKASVERLVTLVRRDAERREKETRILLEKKYGYSDEQLDKATKKIIREEKRIYQVLANLFATRDNVAIENLSITFEEAVDPYRALVVPKLVESNDADGEDNSADLKRLKELNQALNEELKVNMNTLSRMLHEYSALLADKNVDKDAPDAVAALIVGDQASEVDTSSIAAGDVAEEESMPDVTTEADVLDAADKDLDSATLVGMFQEDDDEALTEGGTATAAAINEAPAEALSAEEEMLNELLEPENAVDKSEPVEDLLAQEIGEVLESKDADLSNIELDAMDGTPAESATDTDPAEALLAQAIGETLESHETPLPDIENEVLEDEAEAEATATAIDPTEDLLAQAIDATLESHETLLPDIKDEVLEDETEAATELDAEKKLTDEIAETLSGHSENMSDEDIDSLLQGASEDISEK